MLDVLIWGNDVHSFLEQATGEAQAKKETVDKVCMIVKKQLAVPDGTPVTAESKFSELGADSLDTVNPQLPIPQKWQ